MESRKYGLDTNTEGTQRCCFSKSREIKTILNDSETNFALNCVSDVLTVFVSRLLRQNIKVKWLLTFLKDRFLSSQGLAFRKGTHQLFSGAHDRTVKIWNLDEMAYIETL